MRVRNCILHDCKIKPLYYKGELIKNVSVGSYVQIRKGFITLIGKIDGEKTEITNFSNEEKSF